jgi:hypothetical protein
MTAYKIASIVGILLVILIVGFFIYLHALSSAYSLHKPDKRPYFITTEPLIIKNILLPIGTKIIYQKGYFWQRGQQRKPREEKDIFEINLLEGTTIDWGGIPVTSFTKFYNDRMNGFSVYPDFEKLDTARQTGFSRLWQSCSEDLGISVNNLDDWSFNKQNILDIESCGMTQRYFKEDLEQQAFLDSLFIELKKVEK